jgi:nucleoside phosphorylase
MQQGSRVNHLCKIVVTFAVESEFTAWRRMAPFEPAGRNGIPIYRMRSGSTDIYAVITGIGTRWVGSELRELLAGPAGFCIASGLAGGLKTQYLPGTVLVAKAVKGNGTRHEIRSNDFLVDAAQLCGAAAVDFFFTSQIVLNTPAEKSRLGQIADAVEMESFNVLCQANESGVPAVTVRAISDTVQTHMPMDFNRIIDTRGQIGWVPALREIAKAPQRIPQLIRFGLESSRASQHLARFLDRYTKLLSGSWDSRLTTAAGESI